MPPKLLGSIYFQETPERKRRRVDVIGESVIPTPTAGTSRDEVEGDYESFESMLRTVDLSYQLLNLSRVYSPDLPWNAGHIRDLYLQYKNISPPRVSLVDEIRASPAFQFMKALSEIPYFTPKLARRLYDAGAQCINDVDQEPFWGMLGRAQKAGFKFRREFVEVSRGKDIVKEIVGEVLGVVLDAAVKEIREEGGELLVLVPWQRDGLVVLLEELDNSGWVEFTLEMGEGEARIIWKGKLRVLIREI
ncbi:hypothetical protein RUND412_001893 [Rhizina undulata]